MLKISESIQMLRAPDALPLLRCNILGLHPEERLGFEEMACHTEPNKFASGDGTIIAVVKCSFWRHSPRSFKVVVS